MTMRTWLCGFLLVVVGCTPKEAKKDGSGRSTDPAKCASVGQTCELSPGKLGTCVARDDCTSDCFVCQSQH